MNKTLSELENKKILILGYGREGQSTLAFLKKYYPDKKIDIADQKTSSDYLKSLDSYDLIFKSPGIPNKLPEIKKAKEKGVKFTSQTKLFFALCKGTIIGVTGTKGKSTTTSLIHHILSSANKKSILLGNIGKPCLDYLDDTFGSGTHFCFELSSHQLSDMDRSPHIAVLLNIFREHLDYYEDFDDYLQAKINITRFQKPSDYSIYNKEVPEFAGLEEITQAKCIEFTKAIAKDYQNNTKLVGEHNLNNIAAAVVVARILKIKEEDIALAISTFAPLEHRLETVGTYNSITFIEDSLATIPEATISAIKTFSGRVGSIILGGSDRGQDFGNLAQTILNENIQTVILFPTTGNKIWDEIQKLYPSSPPKHYFVDSMEEAVKYCFEQTPKDMVCLLSTASPSFTLFKDYEDKANQFRQYVEKYNLDHLV